jgi:hypothetical protein
MSNIAYNVNMEFTLQDNVSKKLDEVANQFGNVEQIATKVIAEMGKAYANAGGVAQKAFEKMVASLKKAGKSLKMEDVVNEVVKLKKATGEYEGYIKGLELEQSKLTKETEGYSDALTKMSQANFHWDETEQLKEIAALYTDFEKNKLPNLRVQYELNKNTNKKAAEADMKAIKEWEGLKKKYQRQEMYINAIMGRKRKQYRLEAGKELKEENQSWTKMMLFRSNTELRLMREHAEQIIRKNMVTAALNPILKDQLEIQNKQVQATIDQIEKVEVQRKALDRASSAYGKIKGGMGSIIGMGKSALGAAGLGKIMEATSLTGLYGIAVMEAAQEAEKFHTANFRLLGSMENIQASIADASIATGLLRSELIDSTIALREVGFASEGIGELRDVIAGTNRITGASLEVQAKFARAMEYSTKDVNKAKEELYLMQGATKAIGLTGKDIEEMLGKATQASYILGARGESYVGEYTKMLLKAGAAAKKLGMDTSETAKTLAYAYNPDDILRLKGAADNFGIDASKFAETAQGRMELAGAFAKKFMSDLKAAGENIEERKKVMASSAAILKTSEEYFEFQQQLEAIALTANTVIPAEKELVEQAKKLAKQEPTEAMNKGLQESTGLVRTTDKALSNFTSVVQKEFRFVGGEVKGFVEKMGQWEPMLKTIAYAFATWGVIGTLTSVLGSIWNIGKGVLGLKIAFGIFGGAATTAGTAATGAFTAAATSAGLTVVAGIAAAVALAGIAWAGWEAYKAWDKARESIKNTDDALKTAKKNIKEAGVGIKEDAETAAYRLEIEKLKKEQEKYKPLKKIREYYGQAEGALAYAQRGFRHKDDEEKFNKIENKIRLMRDAENRMLDRKRPGQEAELNNNMKIWDIKKEQAKIQERLIGQQKNLTDLEGLRSEYAKAGNKNMVKDLDEQIQAETKLLAETKAAMDPATIEKKLSEKQKPAAAPVEEGVGAHMKSVQESMEKTMAGIMEKVPKTLEGMEKAPENLRTLKEDAKAEPTPTPITTTKVSNDTGRTIERNDTVPRDRALAQISAVENISNMLSSSPNAIKDLVDMLNIYLPRIAEGGQKSLNPTANQWT